MIWVLFAHYMGDFAMQKEWVALNKHKYWYVLLAHAMIWSGCVCIALALTGEYQDHDAGMLIVGHFLCDKLSRNATRKFPSTLFYVDQCFHVAQCALAYYL